MDNRRKLLRRRQFITDQISDLEEELQLIEEDLTGADDDADLTVIVENPDLGILDEMNTDPDDISDRQD